MKSLAIIIPIYKEEEHIILRCFEAYNSINYNGKYRVYIALNHADIETINIATKIFNDPKFVICVSDKENHLKASNVNYCFPIIQEEVIAVFDVDNIPLGNYCNACVGALNDNIGFTCGHEFFPNENANILTKHDAFQHKDYVQFIGNIYKEVNKGVLPIVSAGYFMERKTWNKIKLNENTITEDQDLSMQLDKLGIKGELVNEEVSMLLPETFKNHFNQRVRWHTGSFTLVSQHPNMFRDNTNMAVLLAPSINLLRLNISKISCYILLLIILPFYWSLPVVAYFIFSELEAGHNTYMRTHGYLMKSGKILSRKLTYFTGLMEYIYIPITIKAYYRFKKMPLYWYLTKK